MTPLDFTADLKERLRRRQTFFRRRDQRRIGVYRQSNREHWKRPSRQLHGLQCSAGSQGAVRWLRSYYRSTRFQCNRFGHFHGCLYRPPSGSLCLKDVDRDSAARCGTELQPKLQMDHYVRTPYAYESKRARKPVPPRCVDLAQGLFEMIEELDHGQRPVGSRTRKIQSQASQPVLTRIK